MVGKYILHKKTEKTKKNEKKNNNKNNNLTSGVCSKKKILAHWMEIAY